MLVAASDDETVIRFPHVERAIQDDEAFLHQPDSLAANLDEIRDLGFTRLRVTANWDNLAPRPRARVKPAFDAADPAAYDALESPFWASLDRVVREAADRDIALLIDIGFWAPRWAAEATERDQAHGEPGGGRIVCASMPESRASGGRDTVRRPLFANVLYPRFREAAREHGEDRYRERLLEGLRGRVLELGCGDGDHFRHFPSSVTELVGVEPEENLRRRAGAAAAKAPCPVRILPGFAEHLPAEDGEFDAAVAALVLCSVSDQQAALAELTRAIRPGGELRFFEHVRADTRLHAAAQLAVQPVWAQLGGGCHLARETEQAIRDAGFEIERIERFDFAAGMLQKLAGPHILGIARRP